jgi:hypothetical protein
MGGEHNVEWYCNIELFYVTIIIEHSGSVVRLPVVWLDVFFDNITDLEVNYEFVDT